MADNKTIVDKLAYVQSRLRAPKGQYNKFGGYTYRSAEDILESVKPLCAEVGLALTITDRVEVMENGWAYIVATAAVQDGMTAISTQGWAREPETRKGMDAAQVTGSSSSYARKYALNGLFAIDDAKDPDATNDHGKGQPAAQPKAATPPKAPAQPGRDYSALRDQTERLAKVHGTTVPNEYRWIVENFGDPKTKSDDEYAALIRMLAEMEA